MRTIHITNAGGISLPEGPAEDLAGEKFAMFNFGDHYLAVQNRFPDAREPLADCLVPDEDAALPAHAIDLEGEASLETYALRVEDGILLVQFPRRYEVAA